jgi:rifampin ADP-ribosylating transferase
LKIVGELESWEPFDPEYIQRLKDRIEAGSGEIIN